MGKTGSIVIAGLAGLAAGVAIGILFAPDKGSATRKKIRKTMTDTLDKVTDEVQEKFNEVKAFVRRDSEKAADVSK